MKLDAKTLISHISRMAPGELGIHLDAGETVVYARQLEYIISELYNVLYADNKARSLFPVNTNVDNAAETYTYRQHDWIGEARIINDAASDFPNVTLTGDEIRNGIKGIGVSYQYDIQQMRRAARAGLQLEMELANAARRATENKLETIAAFGDTNFALNGFTNFANLATFTLATKTAGGVAWYNSTTKKGNATVNEILSDISGMSSAIFAGTKGVHRGDTLILDIDTFAYLNSTFVNTSFRDDTILQFVLKNIPFLKSIDFWLPLSTAGAITAANGGLTPRIMLYQKDPAVVQLVIPQEFEQFAPQPRMMAFRIPCHMRTGGITVRYPKAICWADGVQL